MVNMTGVITLEQLAKHFTSLFHHRAFRLETLDFYDAANEREPYAAFLAGQPVDPAWRRPWQGLVRGVRESGRMMERVHIVSEPVTDYIRFSLLHGYPASVEAGEDVRILDAMLAAPVPGEQPVPQYGRASTVTRCLTSPATTPALSGNGRAGRSPRPKRSWCQSSVSSDMAPAGSLSASITASLSPVGWPG